MLKLNRQEDLLTQGQSPARRVLANPNVQRAPEGEQAGESPTGASPSAGQGPAPAGGPAGASPDAQLIASKVYELMRRDLLIMHERSAPGR